MQRSASGTPTGFTALQFLNANDGWVATTGVVGATTDGGVVWNWYSLPTGIAPTGMAFTSATSGWLTAMTAACGGGIKTAASCDTVLMRTADAGATWTQQDSVACGDLCAPGQIDAVDSQHAWAIVHCAQGTGAACGGLLQTADGGTMWSAVALPTGFRPRRVDFLTVAEGWVSGSDCPAANNTLNACRAVVERTTDGGSTWQPEALPPPLTGGSVSFANAEDGFLVPSPVPFCTMQGCWVDVYATRDGGQTWSKVTSTYRRSGFQGMPTFVSPTVGFVPVSPGAGGGTGGLAITTDGGHSWTSSGSDEWAIGALSAVSANNIWAIGGESLPPGASRGFLVHSTDGGRTWAQVLPSAAPTTAVDFLNSSVGFGIGTATNTGAVVATTDGGAHWTILTPPGEGVTLQYISFANAHDGWVAGTIYSQTRSTPVLYATADAGHTWHTLAQPAGAVVGLGWSDAGHGWMATDTFPGAKGTTTLWRTSHGGRSWTRSGLLPMRSELMGVSVNGEAVWAISFDSERPGFALAASTSGGATWSPVAEFPFDSAGPMIPDLTGPGQGWVKQRLGTNLHYPGLFYTSDGGQTWTEWTLPGMSVTAMDFISPTQGWLIASANLWHTVDGGATWIQLG